MIALVALLLACGGSADMAFDDTAGSNSYTDDYSRPGLLRVDVIPASDDLGLLPQSFEVEPRDYRDRAYDLASTVSVTGELSALTYTGWGVAPPATSVPLEATVSATLPDALQAGAGSSSVGDDDIARFSFQVPAGDGYLAAIVPADATSSPFSVFPSVRLDQDQDWSQQLDPGAPVSGRVVDASGNPVARVSLELVRADVDVSSAPFVTDDEGWFLARVVPGYDYVLRSVAERWAGAPRPAVELPFTVADASGAELELDLGALETAQVSGLVLDEAGDEPGELTIRVRAESLAGSDGGFEYSQTQQGTGYVAIDLLPGRYTVELIPAYGSGLTPRVVDLELPDGGADLGEIRLDGSSTFAGEVRTAGGNAVVGATVTVQETAFDEYAWNTTTDSDGSWTIAGLPSLPMEVTVTPQNPDAGAVSRTYQDPGSLAVISLAEGELVSGVVSTRGVVVPYAFVEVRDAASLEVVGRAVTDSEGNFSLRIDPALLRPDDDSGLDTDSGGTDSDAGDTGDTGATTETGDSGTDTGTGTDTGGDTGGGSGSGGDSSTAPDTGGAGADSGAETG